MKTLIATGLSALALSLSVGTMADPGKGKSEAWDADKADQIAINRCANAGKGNGGERIRRNGTCQKNRGGTKAEDRRWDIDPGNSDK